MRLPFRPDGQRAEREDGGLTEEEFKVQVRQAIEAERPRCMPHLRRIAPPGRGPVEVLRLVEPGGAGIGEPGI